MRAPVIKTPTYTDGIGANWLPREAQQPWANKGSHQVRHKVTRSPQENKMPQRTSAFYSAIDLSAPIGGARNGQPRPQDAASYTKTWPGHSYKGAEGCRSIHRCIERASTQYIPRRNYCRAESRNALLTGKKTQYITGGRVLLPAKLRRRIIPSCLVWGILYTLTHRSLVFGAPYNMVGAASARQTKHKPTYAMPRKNKTTAAKTIQQHISSRLSCPKMDQVPKES